MSIIALYGSPRRQGNSAHLLAAPIFFYAVPAQVKALMDCCQPLWVRKYWFEKKPLGRLDNSRPGLFIAVGATRGKKLFAGAEMSVRYFFDTFDVELRRLLTCRGLDGADEVLEHPDYLEEARK